MRDTINGLKAFGKKYKVVAALGLIFVSGVLAALAVSSAYYESQITKRTAAYDRQIARLLTDVDVERQINRGQMQALAGQVSELADQLVTITQVSEDNARALKKIGSRADVAVKRATTAAQSAQEAATTVQDAAQTIETAAPKVAPTPKAKKKSSFPITIEP